MIKITAELIDGRVPNMPGASAHLMERCGFLLMHGYTPAFTLENDTYTLNSITHTEMGHKLEDREMKAWAEDMLVDYKKEEK